MVANERSYPVMSASAKPSAAVVEGQAAFEPFSGVSAQDIQVCSCLYLCVYAPKEIERANESSDQSVVYSQSK